MFKIPVIDLRRQYTVLQREIDQAIAGVLMDSEFILGPRVSDFESQLAEYCLCHHVVGVASGTDALMLILMATKIRSGDEIITTPFTFMASSSVISRSGAKPVFVDIDPETFNINVAQIETAITPKTRAILPVHLFGHPVEMESLLRMAKDRGLYVFEDAAQAIGARYKDKPVGSLGDLGGLSFFPTKNLGAYGDGGAVLTNNSDLAGKIRVLRQHGSSTKYIHEFIGINSRLDSIQASILSVKLKHLDQWIQKRRKIAEMYKELLKDLPVICPTEKPGCVHTYHQFTIKVPEYRDDLKLFLQQQGIQTVVYYPKPIHLQPAYDFLGYKRGQYPVAENACTQVLSLPCYPELTDEEVLYVSNNVRRFFKHSTNES